MVNNSPVGYEYREGTVRRRSKLKANSGALD